MVIIQPHNHLNRTWHVSNVFCIFAPNLEEDVYPFWRTRIFFKGLGWNLKPTTNKRKTLCSVSPNITPYCPIQPFWNLYIAGICLYVGIISRILSQKITQLLPFVEKCQVYTLQLDPHTGLLDEKDLSSRLQKIQSLKPGESNMGGPRVGH